MRLLLTLLVISFNCFASLNLSAQSDSLSQSMPVYPGGEQALFSFLSENLVYPEEALMANVSGKVYVRFVVERDGSTSGHKIHKGLDPSAGLNEEALRVVKMLDGYKPGYMNGDPVRIEMVLPVVFKIDENHKGEKKKKK